jgi:hydroxymethylbilane synthase
VLEREDPRDALLSSTARDLSELPARARVGTSSLRRRAFLARSRSDLSFVELRGNVPTRIERLMEGKYDAIVLAAAGLNRLGLARHISAHLDPVRYPPAVSQGAICVCTRSEDERALGWVRLLDHAPTRLATSAERALLRRVEGGCQVPLGALARLVGRTLRLHASVCALDGSTSLAAHGDTDLAPESAVGAGAVALEAAAGLGERLAEELLGKGARELIQQQRTPREVELP